MHPNEELARKGYGVFNSGDLEGTLAFFSDDIDWHVGGRHSVTGDYKGRDAVHEFFTQLFNLTDGSFRIETEDFLANDTRFVVIGTMTGRRGDKRLNQRFVHVWRGNGEIATEFWHIPFDQYVDDDFWA